MVNCRGCGRKQLKRSGIAQHCSRSNDPRCKAYLAQLRCHEPSSLGYDSRVQAGPDRTDIIVLPPSSLLSSLSSFLSPISLVFSLSVPSTVDLLDTKEFDGSDSGAYLLEIAGSDKGNSTGLEDEDNVAGSDDKDESDDEDEDSTGSNSDIAPITQHDIGLEPRRHTLPPSPEVEPATGSPSENEQPQDDDILQKRGEVGPVLKRCPKITRYLGGNAGVVHSKTNTTENQNYEAKVGETSQANAYAPFASCLEWEIAKWAKLRGPSSTAFTEMMVIDGIVVGDEVCEVFYRDILQCIRTLFGDPDLAPYLIFAPEKHYINDERTEQMYHDMHTGSWWWSTQAAVERDTPGATIVPVLISTDKTHAYPIYMTIGNIPKEIRRKTSLCAYVLLGYLPMTKLELEKNKARWKRLTANLYHACMRRILNPLALAGENGLVHRNHPILASFIGDYPEQVLTTCSLSGDCPTCGTLHNNLGDFKPDNVPLPRKLDEFLEALNSFWTCSEIRVKPVPQPFWLGLPHLNICRSITPDVLHQLYQGVIKHLKSWVIEACDAAEIDARCLSTPPKPQHSPFYERDQQSVSFFLGLVIDIRLPNNLSNVRLLHSVRAILDLLYLAQYPIHTDSTLGLLTDALSQFHANKDIFLIRTFGTTDNFNTQYTEHLHIDLAKDAYAATNHKDEYEQMTIWLDRKEAHPSPQPKRVDWVPPSLNPHRELTMAKRPTRHGVPLSRLQDSYGAPLFKVALRRFISATNNPDQTRQQLEGSLWGLRLPFTRLPVWHVIKFTQFDPVTGKYSTSDAIHAQPTQNDKYNRPIPGRFNTALINDGTGKEHGVKGYHVGHIRAIFSIPQKYHVRLFNPMVSVPLHLAYVQWYSPLTDLDTNYGMFKIQPQTDLEGNWICSIVPVGNIQRSVHLLPKFGPVVPAEWTSSNVLDCCDTFFVNNLTDWQIFHTLHNSVD
ncbi:hypothetical protein BJY52DRAFT_1206005 [Lactarius psammicola]|nr:hypothetical protein BJY52DRAFT_1206005 [Lactarius psammicola]